MVPAGACQVTRFARARALLVARKQLQHKLIDIELSIRGILRGFGLKVGHVTTKTFEERIRKLVTGHATLELIAEAMLVARAALLKQFNKLHKAVLDIVRNDEVCGRFMTTVSSGGKLVKNQRFENGHWVSWDRMVRPSGSSLPPCSPP